MKQIIIPYTVEFIRRRCRTVESLVVWDELPVAICEVSDRETSIAYNIGPYGSSSPAYDIRSFRGKTWWPSFDRSQALSVDAFITSIDDPNGCFLTTLNLSPSTLHSYRWSVSEVSLTRCHLALQLEQCARYSPRTLQTSAVTTSGVSKYRDRPQRFRRHFL
jgi:hypothetical protein